MEPDEFLKIQQKKEEIGRAAELRIIEYERERLCQLPDLAKNIVHTADRDVTAGYDIKSFETRSNEDGNSISRFIEVKAVSLLDYRFYWTRNEIEKSKYYQDKYFLYLLPIAKKTNLILECF